VRDIPGHRYLDRSRIRHTRFAGAHVSVAGPLTVPRSPQGVLALTAFDDDAVAAQADIIRVAGADLDDLVARARAARTRTAEGAARPRVFGDLEVIVGVDADDRARALTAYAAAHGLGAAQPVAPRFVGTKLALRETLRWAAGRAGLDGFVLRPGVLAHDLEGVAETLSHMTTAPH
jgi:hypothetical protein